LEMRFDIIYQGLGPGIYSICPAACVPTLGIKVTRPGAHAVLRNPGDPTHFEPNHPGELLVTNLLGSPLTSNIAREQIQHSKASPAILYRPS